MGKYLHYLNRYREHSTTIIFFGGFFFDLILLPNIDDPKAKFFALGYILVIGFLIFLREWIVARNRATVFEEKLYSLTTFGIVCFCGSTLSFIFIYAVRSAALSVSWPLFLILVICILANEFVSTHNFRLTLDIGILYVATLFFLIFHIPVILKSQNDATFGISIAIAIALCSLFIYFLKPISDTAEKEAPRIQALAIGIPMFVGMLYFLNVLPAVPLSLKESGVHHYIIRTSEAEFIAQTEEETRGFAKFRTPVYHMTEEDMGVYFFSAINAPTELFAPISHVWEHYDNNQKKWIESLVISFDLAGGREDGYRAYSNKEKVEEGLWRVTVKVDDKRIVGRTKFIVEKTNFVKLKEIKL